MVIGDRLGLYRVLATSGALTAAELAAKSGTHERYVREWLNAHAASGYVNYLADSGRYQLSPEQAMLFAQEESPGVHRRGLSDRAGRWSHRRSAH